MSRMLYDKEIDDELMIQFIILYALNHSDEPLPYAAMLSVIQENCEISFTDLQLGLDNLIQTGHVSVTRISDILSIYDVTQKGKYVIDFFYKHIPLIVREPIDRSLKDFYLDKRRREAVQASIEPINEREFNAECRLYNDDRMIMMSLTLYAGDRKEAERIAETFKKNSADIYAGILEIFSKKERADD